MYTLDELKQQNQEISQLCDVLAVLMEEENLHNNPYVCELMQRFKEKVWVHLVSEENTIYASLMDDDDEHKRKIMKEFHENAREIKHQFSAFVRQWCSMPGTDEEHHQLTDQSRDINGQIRKRIEYENKQIFPLVK